MKRLLKYYSKISHYYKVSLTNYYSIKFQPNGIRRELFIIESFPYLININILLFSVI